MERIGIVIKPHAEDIENKVETVVSLLLKNNFKVLVDKTFIFDLRDVEKEEREKIPEKSDLIVVMGGDGTFLSIAHITAQKGKPILGINLGNLGFLTEFTFNEFIDFIPTIKNQNFSFTERTLLIAEAENRSFYALNDIVIAKEHIARMINLEVFVEGKFFSTIRADGLIVATPTGSTAYNLSSGGPIITPSAKNIIITPICPHSLTLKPVIISGDCCIKVKVKKGGHAFLTVDGQRGVELKEGSKVSIKKAAITLKTINNPKRDYFSILREKLKWG